jgi:hypothetical protein
MEIQLKGRHMSGQRHDTVKGTWIPLMDYAIKKGISLSTLRRHIKAKKLTHKIEEGRYLLWDGGDESVIQDLSADVSSPVDPLENKLQKLTYDLKRAQEEIAELKTLIALYEENIPQQRLNN